MKAAGILACLGIVLVLAAGGCSEDKRPFNPDPGIDWPDLTAPEDVIDYLLLTYEHREYERYKNLLHPQYVWFLQPRDAVEYNTPSLDYAADTEGTEKLFKRAVMLELEIDPGTWNEIQQVGEEPCPGCWETDRVYRIRAQLPGSDIIFTGNDQVKFIVVPVQQSGKTIYQIRWAYDIDSF